jgi:hypothetical protein
MDAVYFKDVNSVGYTKQVVGPNSNMIAVVYTLIFCILVKTNLTDPYILQVR